MSVKIDLLHRYIFKQAVNQNSYVCSKEKETENKEFVILKTKFNTESRGHRVYLPVNHEGLKGVFTKDTKGWLG